MNEDIEELLRRASELPESDRAELAGRLLETLPDEQHEGVEIAWAEEIERRIRQLDSGQVKTIAWADVRANLRRSLLAHQCAKLEPQVEQSLANENYVADSEWPDY